MPNTPNSDAITSLLSLAGLVAVVWGIAFWAWKARSDRSASVGLYLLFGFPGGLLALAGIAVIASGQNRVGMLLLLPGVGLTLPLVRAVREGMAAFLPIDPESTVDMTGLCLVLGAIGVLLGLGGFPEILIPAEDVPAISYLDLISQPIAFFLIALAAVGWKIVRTSREAIDRLGLVAPDLRTIGIGVGATVVCFVVAAIPSVLATVYQPELAAQLDRVTEQMTGGIQNVAGAFLIGIGAGLGEETLFRGALQPRFGIGLTSVLFALLHAPQYGANFAIIGLLLVSIVLGFERKYVNTTAAVITHALFNGIQVALLALA